MRDENRSKFILESGETSLLARLSSLERSQGPPDDPPYPSLNGTPLKGGWRNQTVVVVLDLTMRCKRWFSLLEQEQ